MEVVKMEEDAMSPCAAAASPPPSLPSGPHYNPEIELSTDTDDSASDLTGETGQEEVSSALEALQAIGPLDPSGEAARSQVAALVQRLAERCRRYERLNAQLQERLNEQERRLADLERRLGDSGGCGGDNEGATMTLTRVKQEPDTFYEKADCESDVPCNGEEVVYGVTGEVPGDDRYHSPQDGCLPDEERSLIVHHHSSQMARVQMSPQQLSPSQQMSPQHLSPSQQMSPCQQLSPCHQMSPCQELSPCHQMSPQRALGERSFSSTEQTSQRRAPSRGTVVGSPVSVITSPPASVASVASPPATTPAVAAVTTSATVVVVKTEPLTVE